ncbi:MAG TPA: SDR family oxidoreductase [Bryobacteraceae bacterium]|nr:SDR family oxidoreductase [Bryobacteraceae bacterium]
MGKRLDGKVALITGGNSGIGLATAQEFVTEGAFVYITGRRQAELDLAVKMIGNNVVAVPADVSKMSDLDDLYAQISREKNRLDIVFANAGVGRFAPMGSVTEEDFDWTFGINVKGLLFTVQKALPLIPPGGSVILNASIVSTKALPNMSVYSATKAALRSFARSWTLDLKERNIRVNALSPGSIYTPGVAGLASTEEERQALYNQLSSLAPMGRMGQPAEVAKAAVFLASGDASYITGIELFVDGGAAQV